MPLNLAQKLRKFAIGTGQMGEYCNGEEYVEMHISLNPATFNFDHTTYPMSQSLIGHNDHLYAQTFFYEKYCYKKPQLGYYADTADTEAPCNIDNCLRCGIPIDRNFRLWISKAPTDSDDFCAVCDAQSETYGANISMADVLKNRNPKTMELWYFKTQFCSVDTLDPTKESLFPESKTFI
jgi:hypothetical protein